MALQVANPTLGKAPLPEESQGPTPKHKFEGHQNNVSSFVFLHDNVHIVSSSRDGTIRKWNCETGLPIGEPWEAGRGIWALALSPNGKIFACGREDGKIQLWNTDGKMIRRISTGHSDTVRSLAWSHSGGHIASGFSDGTILFQKVNKGEFDMRPIETKQGVVCSLAYSPSGDRIVSGGDKSICPTGTARLVSFLSARPKTSGAMWIQLCGHQTAANCTPPPTKLHVCLTVSRAHYFTASSTMVT
jgi:WD40 repeat protein